MKIKINYYYEDEEKGIMELTIKEIQVTDGDILLNITYQDKEGYEYYIEEINMTGGFDFYKLSQEIIKDYAWQIKEGEE